MKTRVLLVDDEEQFVDTLSERLAIRDYEITKSLYGEDALRKIKKAFARKDEHEECIRTAMVSDSISSPRSVLEDD